MALGGRGDGWEEEGGRDVAALRFGSEGEGSIFALAWRENSLGILDRRAIDMATEDEF